MSEQTSDTNEQDGNKKDPNQDPVQQLPRTRPGGQTDSATGEKPGGGYGHPQSNIKKD